MKSIAIIINAYSNLAHSLNQSYRLKEEFCKLGVGADILRNGGRALIDGGGNVVSPLTGYDCCVYLDKDKYLSSMLERAGMRLFNSHSAVEACDDKMTTFIALAGSGIPVPETIPAPLCYDADAHPSAAMLAGHPQGASGNCIACVMEGTRPVLSELQALVTKTSFPSPRRTASGFDYNRMYLLLAVLEKRTGYVFGNQDVYLNVIGGLRLDETACDLPACLAMASSLLDLPIPEKTLAMGEVGLGGEVRSVPHLETRLREAQRVGFDTAIVPRHNLKMIDPRQFPGLRLIGVAYLREAVNAIKLKD